MHYLDSPGPKNRRQAYQCYSSTREVRKDIAMVCQIGDRIQVGNSVEVVVLDVRDDEVVLEVDDKSVAVSRATEE